MRRLALRRFPTEVIRLRHGPPTRNIYGETVAGQLVRTIHPARVLPLSLEDSNFVGGVSLVERLKVYSPIGIQRKLGTPDTIRWGNGVLMWGGEPITWGGDGVLTTDDTTPFLAAFDDRGGDILDYQGIQYVVVETQTWARYSRAIVLRET